MEKIEKKLSYFSNLLICPGVEFEATPGIHLLFIFDPLSDLNKIESFLIDCGFTVSEQGIENGVIANIDVLQALGRVKQLQGITIAAHIDSDKGIYNSLQGQYRANVFSSDLLDGISVNSTVTIEKIRALLNNPEYKRTKPLSIIQCSDHHIADDCGKLFSYFRLPNKNWENLKLCFTDPNEMISTTEKPEIIGIIKKIALDNNTVCCENINYSDFEIFACAVLNNTFGNILIGVTCDKYKNIKGCECKVDELRGFIQIFKTNIDTARFGASFEIIEYPFGSKKVLNVKIENIRNRLFYVNSKLYFLEDGKICENNVTLALTKEKINCDKKIDEFHEKIDENIEIINGQLSLLFSVKQNYRIVELIEEDSIQFCKTVKLSFSTYRSENRIGKYYNHGLPDGPVNYVNHGRQREDVYLRITCPSTDTIDIHKYEKKSSGESMIIAPMGITHYINKPEWVVLNNSDKNPILLLTFDDDYLEYFDLKTLVAWTKSSLFIYYMYCKTGDTDLYDPNVFNNIMLPLPLFKKEIICSLNKLVDIVIKLEKDFLIQENDIIKLSNKDSVEKKIVDISKDHNKKVENVACLIDKLIYQCFSLPSKSILAVERFLSTSKMLIPRDQ